MKKASGEYYNKREHVHQQHLERYLARLNVSPWGLMAYLLHLWYMR